ncbi:MAG: hypothetical protein JW892_04755 [Anaerolineae bacterium]|nr:hypothetical protein [Anaerolineae bacterium]
MKPLNIRRLVTAVMLLSTLLSLTQSATAQAPAADTQAEIAAAWSGFLYEFVAGSTLRPRFSTTTWSWGGAGGCIYATANANEVFNVPLSLPEGSRIDYLRLYFYDTSASNSTAWLSYYNGAGGLVDLPNPTGVVSSGNSGYGTTLSTYMGHIVDNLNHAYVLNWKPVVSGGTMMLCGLRVAYRLSLPRSVYLPLTMKNY